MSAMETNSPNLFVVGLNSRSKQRHFAALSVRHAEKFDLQKALSHLTEIRRHTLDNLDHLKQQFLKALEKDNKIKKFLADDAASAVAYIDRVAGQRQEFAINKSEVVGELKPLLKENNYQLIDTYFSAESEDILREKVLNHSWQLPVVPTDFVFESFTVENQNIMKGRKDYAALLGVAAASAEDGSVYFLQHSKNISELLQEAATLILVIGIEKIVSTKDEALFQTKCMGTFGLESIILDLNGKKQSQGASRWENLDWEDLPQDIHIILLDNGRSNIAKSDYFSELLTCISCRACAKQCPMHFYFNENTVSSPKQYLWSYLTGQNHMLDQCTGCGMCHFECPLDIKIPHLISLARNKELPRWSQIIKSRTTSDPWLLMLLANRFSPMSNLILDNTLFRRLIENLTGFQKEASIIKASHRTFEQWSGSRK
ncbi:MAG: lactate utilization protein [Deltaproteobacteria bacterium]|nr:lactate utilization protein [Deltaproteobacteria bacterium]MBW2140665.1 lactate utilization protein [Deltaproteobacteria bacterium]